MDPTTANGYQASSPSAVHSASNSPGMGAKAMAKHSPPPGTAAPQRPNLRVVIPNSRGDGPVSDEVSRQKVSHPEQTRTKLEKVV